jgi:hypothetical protein
VSFRFVSGGRVAPRASTRLHGSREQSPGHEDGRIGIVLRYSRNGARPSTGGVADPAVALSGV